MSVYKALTIIILFVSVFFGGLNGLCEADPGIRYGGQYYPGEFVLKGDPGFWEKYGLKVHHILFSSGAENNQALISGKCDINCGSDSKTVGLFNAMGDRVIIIATIQKGDRYSTIVSVDSPYKRWEDLKGKAVGTRLGTGAEQILRRYFGQKKNLSWEDFNWVNMKVENMIAALQSGSIEAFTAWEPTCAIAEAQGVGRVMRTYGDVSPVPVALHTTVDFAKNHRPEIVKFLAAHLDKADFIRNNPDKAAEIAAKAAGSRGYTVPADAFKRVFKRIDFSLDIDDDIVSAIQNTGRFLYGQKKITGIPVIICDGSFLEEAKKLRERKQ